MRVSPPRLIFDLGAEGYAWLTRQEIWRNHCREVAGRLGRGPARSPDLVLDLGVGPGVSAFAIRDRWPASRCVGVDFSRQMLAIARRLMADEPRPVELLRADAGRLPFPDSSFDAVLGHSFLYLVSERDLVLEETVRVLAPGASFAFLEPREQGSLLPGLARYLFAPRFLASMLLWRLVSSGVGRWSGDDLVACLGQVGFTDIRIETTLHGLGWLVTGRKP